MTSALLARAMSLRNITAAWGRIAANDASDGQLSWGVQRFIPEAAERLVALHQDLQDGTYTPAALHEVVITSGGKERTLHIPPVRDRIVARAMLVAITPIVNPLLGCASYAYRPGLGVTEAVHAVTMARDSGAQWVLCTDVDDCFPSIPRAVAFRRLSAAVNDVHCEKLLWLLANRRWGTRKHACTPEVGVPQGCPVSPLLANLVLVDVDNALLNRGFTTVRYADDLAVLTNTRAEAWEAARIITDAIEPLGMRMGSDKTDIFSFQDGFCFLGEDFGPRYPHLSDNLRLRVPEQRIMYLGKQGCRVRTARGRLIVESKTDGEMLNVASQQVTRIVCFGSINVTAGVRQWALQTNVDIVFASRNGKYQGQLLHGARATNLQRLRAQLDGVDHTNAVELARAVVAAKTVKQVVVLRRFNQPETADHVSEAIRSIESLQKMLPTCETREEIMGIEGAIAKQYFPAFGALFPADLQCEQRSKRPPRDVTNAALSFLYTVLYGECVTALVAAGLEPALGVLHTEQPRRHSLALDLMEEFRPMVVDQVVLAAARRHQFTSDHGRVKETEVLLTAKGREVLLDSYEKRMLQQTKGALPDFAGTIRRHLYRQAQRLGNAIVAQEQWTGLSWR